MFCIYRYEGFLGDAKKSGIKKGAVNGVTMGMVWFLIYCAYALGKELQNKFYIECLYIIFFSIGFWYGAKLIREENYNVGNVIIVSYLKK